MPRLDSESVLLSLGSNIDPARHLPLATSLLARHLRLKAASRVFESTPVGAHGTPRFLNAALHVGCEVGPRELKFEVLRPLERRLGRVRSDDPNAPRTIDLDISIFGSLVIDEPGAGLTLPDPDILTAAHVVLPLADVAPEIVHPTTGERLVEIAARFRGAGGIRHFPGLELWPQGEPRGRG